MMDCMVRPFGKINADCSLPVPAVLVIVLMACLCVSCAAVLAATPAEAASPGLTVGGVHESDGEDGQDLQDGADDQGQSGDSGQAAQTDGKEILWIWLTQCIQ